MYLHTSYDTINLRHGADFKTQIAKDLFWVPVNVLGSSRFTNEEIYALTARKPADKIRSLGFNAYEAIQLFQCVRLFEETNDIVYFQAGERTWEMHKSGKYAVETGEGCCASAAAWFNYVIQNRYPDRGYIQYIRPDGSGHTMNYIYTNQHYYIIDLTTQIHTNAPYVPIENGDIKEYCSAQLYTGICFMTKMLLNFARYHCRIQQTAGLKFSYFSMEPYEALPPVCTAFQGDILHIYTLGCCNSILLNNMELQTKGGFKLPRRWIAYSDDYK